MRTVPCQEAEPGLPGSTCIKVRARPDGGDEVEFDTTDPTGDTFRAGQRVRLSILEQAGQPTFYNIRDLERGRPMLALAALFMVAVIAFGRWQGVRSLIGLACSFAVIVGFVVPAILEGGSPVPVALVGAMAIMLISLYLAHGPGRKTTAAVVGTALALGLTAALTAGFVELTALTGLASDDARNASFQVGGISLRGLLLAGIIIGGLGVLDDVTVSQASLVFELRRANPAAGYAELTRGALAVGRDHVSATVNTLFLAYAGASLPLLVLFVSGGEALGTVATAEAVAVEIVRTLCGSVGLVAAVPLTTLLAVGLALEEPAAGRNGGGGGAGARRERPGPLLAGRGMDPGDATALFGRVLDLHGPALSSAVVGVVPGDSVDPGALPDSARQGGRGGWPPPSAGRRLRGRRAPAGPGPARPGRPRPARAAPSLRGVLGRDQGLGRGRSGAGGGDRRQLRRPAPGHVPAAHRRAGPAAGRAGRERPGRGDPGAEAVQGPPPLTAPGR